MVTQENKKGSLLKAIDSYRYLVLLFLGWPVLFALGYMPMIFGEGTPLWFRFWMAVFVALAATGIAYLPKLLPKRRYTRFAVFYTLVQAALCLAGAPIIGTPFADFVPLMGTVIGAVITLLVWVATVVLAWSAYHR